MSLNCFTESDLNKPWMKINANNLFGTNLNITDSVIIRGSTFPSNTTTPGWVLTNGDGLGTLAWAPDAGTGTGITFAGTLPVTVGEVCSFASVDGEAIENTGLLISDIFNANGSIPMTGNLEMSLNNINDVNILTTNQIKVNEFIDMGLNDILNLNNLSANGTLETTGDIKSDIITSYGTSNTRLELNTNDIKMEVAGTNIITLDNTNKATITNLEVSNSANIRGNVFPSNVTSAGYSLVNTDGMGTLAWAPAIGSTVSSGFYTPGIAVSGGSVDFNNGANYLRIGNTVTYSGFVVLTLPGLGGSTFILSVNPPPGSANNNVRFSAIANGGNDPTTKNIFCFYSTFFGGTCNMYMRTMDPGGIFSGGSCNVQYSVSFESTI